MLETLDVKGKIITADAMHCQKETYQKIIKQVGNYCFGLKENQKTLYEDVKLFIENLPTPYSIEISTAQIEKRYGQVEKHCCYKSLRPIMA